MRHQTTGRKSGGKRVELDDIDIKILQRVQDDARIANVELAAQVGLSPAPCLRRVRALERAGVIRRYAALLNPAAVDLPVTVFVQVSLDLQMEGRLEIFERAVMNRPEVLECYLMTGDADYLLRVVVPDVEGYERFLREVLTRIESAAGIKSSFALKQVKYSTALPVTAFARNARSRVADRPARSATSRGEPRKGRKSNT
jgi:Lrp/AsnC family transcriptional regulator, leucine-responsive regulatory protein